MSTALLCCSFPTIFDCNCPDSLRRYETASTRLFKRGRTETIRSCSSEAAELSAAVCARNYPVTQPMRDPYLYALFTKALSKHKQLTQEAMAGQVSLNLLELRRTAAAHFAWCRAATATSWGGVLRRQVSGFKCLFSAIP